MEDGEIVALYWQRSEQAIAETQCKYGGYCYSIAKNILWSAEDSEETVSDTYIGAWNAMPPSRPEQLRTFLGKITRRLALKKLREAYPVHLTIVSGLKQEYVYRVPKYTAQEEAEVQGIIRDNSDWIEYHESLPNEQVLALCKRAHIGLLPTYRDSFGYSTIEMQSCGCVVLSTDIFALPELNDLDIGYVCAIRHAVDALTDGNDAAVQALRPLLAAQLQEQLTRIVEERGKLVDKAQMALARVAQRYDPERHGEAL